MPFHNPAVNDPPLSEVTKEGIPNKDTQECKKAVAAAEELASDSGIAWIIRVVLHIAVSKNLFP